MPTAYIHYNQYIIVNSQGVLIINLNAGDSPWMHTGTPTIHSVRFSVAEIQKQKQ